MSQNITTENNNTQTGHILKGFIKGSEAFQMVKGHNYKVSFDHTKWHRSLSDGC